MSVQQLSIAQNILGKIESDLNNLELEGQLWLIEQLAQRLRLGTQVDSAEIRPNVVASVEKSLKENAVIWQQLA